MTSKRVAAAMSGGVDSSLAAALLIQDGYDVIGVTMQLQPQCQQTDAEKAADKLGIPHHIIDFTEVFSDKVVADFCQEYSQGRTPNPCIRCNQYIKFDALLKKARGLGADLLATGHYARIEPSGDGYKLLRAADRDKDQSYFLYTLTQQQLPHLLLPIGGRDKAEVRRLAAEMGLPAADKPESQDICFIPAGDYRAFVAEHIPAEAGDIIDTEGNILGKHSGLAGYTIGQRQGLGLASNKHLYVIRLDATGNRVVVGEESQLWRDNLRARDLSWVSGEAPQGQIKVTAKIRYQAPQAAATLRINNRAAEVSFQQPQKAIAPGQAVVFYRGDTVLGGGIIEDRKD